MKTWKSGEINPKTGLVYGSRRANGKIQWYSQEAFDRKKEYSKKYYASGKGKQYHRDYYRKNKDRHIKINKEAKEIAKYKKPLNLLYQSIRQGAIRRNLDFDIDKEFVYELWKKQSGKCYYTNISMKYIAFNKDPFQVSIDRKDSNLGYSKTNAVLCCQAINYLKSDYSMETFNNFLIELKQGLMLIKDD